MSDIVERLRRHAELRVASAPKMLEAADEIERLRSELGAEPWNGHRFKEVERDKWRCECGIELVPAARVEALEVGARRYQWLRDRHTRITNTYEVEGREYVSDILAKGVVLDTEIDAALAREGGGNG